MTAQRFPRRTFRQHLMYPSQRAIVAALVATAILMLGFGGAR